MTYRVQHVERLPVTLEDGFVYVSEEYEIAALNCACGCGHRISLLLGDGHIVRDLNGFADVDPSIGVWDASCRSHFFIKNGQVLWANRWSEERIRGAMERQLQRHLTSTKRSQPWYARAMRWVLNRLSIFR